MARSSGRKNLTKEIVKKIKKKKKKKKGLKNIACQRSQWSRLSVDVSLLFSNRQYFSLQTHHGQSYRDSLDVSSVCQQLHVSYATKRFWVRLFTKNKKRRNVQEISVERDKKFSDLIFSLRSLSNTDISLYK